MLRNTYPYICESSTRMYTKVDIWHNNIQWIVHCHSLQMFKLLKSWFFVLYILRQWCYNKQLFSHPLPLVLLFSSRFSTKLSYKSGLTSRSGSSFSSALKRWCRLRPLLCAQYCCNDDHFCLRHLHLLDSLMLANTWYITTAIKYINGRELSTLNRLIRNFENLKVSEPCVMIILYSWNCRARRVRNRTSIML